MRMRARNSIRCFAGARPSAADEGMWTFDNPPLKQLKDKYNFTPTTQWLDHIRLSSVRFNDGGSGSFVSPEWNGHYESPRCFWPASERVSTPKRDYVKDGFYAKTQAEELRVPRSRGLTVFSSRDGGRDGPGARIGQKARNDGEAGARRAQGRSRPKFRRRASTQTGFRCPTSVPGLGGGEGTGCIDDTRSTRSAAPGGLRAPSGARWRSLEAAPTTSRSPDSEPLDFALLRVYENGRTGPKQIVSEWRHGERAGVLARPRLCLRPSRIDGART